MNLDHLNHAARLHSARRVLAVGTLLLASTALTTYLVPGQSGHRERVPWTTRVDYAYAATTAASLVYPDGEVHSGETVFRKLVGRLRVRAAWSLRTPAGQHVEGAARLRVVLNGPGGWTHAFALGSPVSITDERVTLSGTLDLAGLDAQVRRAVELTGIPAEDYTISVRPQVTVRGTVAGVPVTGVDAGPRTAMVLAVTPATVTPVAGRATGLEPDTTTRFVTRLSGASASWQLLGHRLPVAPVRWACTAGALLGLITLALLLLLKSPRIDPCLHQARRHRGSVVSVSDLQPAPTSSVVQVTSIEELARVAQRYDRLILHQVTTPGVYLVEDETGLYRYQCTHRGPAVIDSSGSSRQRIPASHLRSSASQGRLGHLKSE